jgi:RNA polymerase sigma-70 factor (ECF subfamily)
MSPSDPMPELLRERARVGDAAARGRLLELYRKDLRLVARSLAGRAAGAEADPSDLVQETFLKAHRDFPRFAGTAEPELVACLRRILVRTMDDQFKHRRTLRRDARPEQSLEEMLDRSSLAVQEALTAPVSSPSERVARRGQAALPADAPARLPED